MIKNITDNKSCVLVASSRSSLLRQVNKLESFMVPLRLSAASREVITVLHTCRMCTTMQTHTACAHTVDTDKATWVPRTPQHRDTG